MSPPMRNLLAIMEAPRGPRRPARPVVDTAALGQRITALAHALAGHPFGIRPDRAWADQVMEKIGQRRAEWDQMRTADMARGEADPGAFDPSGLLPDAAEAIYQRAKMGTFGLVRADVAHEEGEYQTRAAERISDAAGFESDSHYIEQSDYLSGMDAQKDLASHLDTFLRPSDLKTVETAVGRIEAFIPTWTNHVHVDDGGEQPVLVEGMIAGLACLIPLLAVMVRQAA